MSEESDMDLLTRGRQGDDDAFGILMKRHEVMVRGEIRKYISENSDIDDLAQQTFLNLYKASGPSAGIRNNLAPYIRVIAKHAAFNLIRKRSSDPTINNQNEQIDRTAKPEAIDPLIAKEQSKQHDEMLNRLPPRQQTAIKLRLEGYSSKEIAEKLSITPNAVDRAISHGKKTLKQYFREQGGRES